MQTNAASARGARSSVLPPQGILLMVTIALGWGLNWPAMKVALIEIPPWTFRLLCIVIAAGALLLLTVLRGERARLPLRQVPMVTLIALFAVTGWQMLSAFGLLYIGSGRAAIIAFTMPLWATVLSVLVLGERLTRRHVVALGLGSIALLLLLGDDLQAVGAAPLGGLLTTGAAVCWALGTVLVKRLDLRMPLMAFTAWQLLIGGLPMVIGWWLLEPWPDLGQISAAAWFGLLFASLVGMVVCVTSYFRLVKLVPASVAATTTLAVPVVGVISSALFLGEAVGDAEILALTLVVAALFLLVRGRRPAIPRPSPPAGNEVGG
jgi:drug/metabolite transporter (DMT)-like permease